MCVSVHACVRLSEFFLRTSVSNIWYRKIPYRYEMLNNREKMSLGLRLDCCEAFLAKVSELYLGQMKSHRQTSRFSHSV